MILEEETLAGIKLKINSKKLYSGSHQIKFTVIKSGEKKLQGYLLAKHDSTLKEVIEKIKDITSLMGRPVPYYQGQLFSMNLKNEYKHGHEFSPVIYIKSKLNGLYKY